MKSEINIQRPTRSRVPRHTGCWMFLLFIFIALSLSAQTSTNDLPALVPAYGELPPTEAAADWAAQLRTDDRAILIGNTNVADNIFSSGI